MRKVDPNKVPAIRRAYKELDREADKQIEIIYGSASIALHRYFGWTTDQIVDLNEYARDVWKSVADDITKNPISELERISGIELKCEADGKSWREVGFLNHDVKVGTKDYMTVPQLYAQIMMQKKWLPTVVLACILTGAYRDCGFEVEKLAELMQRLDEVRHELKFDRTQIKVVCWRETGIKINGLKYYIEEFKNDRG